jgi:hypothetical protein
MCSSDSGIWRGGIVSHLWWQANGFAERFNNGDGLATLVYLSALITRQLRAYKGTRHLI